VPWSLHSGSKGTFIDNRFLIFDGNTKFTSWVAAVAQQMPITTARCLQMQLWGASTPAVVGAAAKKLKIELKW
jgi:hypothetical protein